MVVNYHGIDHLTKLREVSGEGGLISVPRQTTDEELAASVEHLELCHGLCSDRTGVG